MLTRDKLRELKALCKANLADAEVGPLLKHIAELERENKKITADRDTTEKHAEIMIADLVRDLEALRATIAEIEKRCKSMSGMEWPDEVRKAISIIRNAIIERGRA